MDQSLNAMFVLSNNDFNNHSIWIKVWMQCLYYQIMIRDHAESSKKHIFLIFRLWEFSQKKFVSQIYQAIISLDPQHRSKPFFSWDTCIPLYVPWSRWSKSVSKVPLFISFPLQTIWIPAGSHLHPHPLICIHPYMPLPSFRLSK
jgi:hypothetical protein